MKENYNDRKVFCLSGADAKDFLQDLITNDIAKEGRTMLIVTHDMRLAWDVSDHVVFLHQGLIEEEGAPDEVFGHPKSERLQQFLKSTLAA